MAVITASGSKATLKFIVRSSDDVITFGNRGQLRTIIKPGVNEQAHHIIPWEHFDHPIVQNAAKGKNNPFHMNDHINGLPLNTSVHSGSHPNYNAWVKNRLDEIDDQLTSEQAHIAIGNIIQQIKTTIAASPGIPINQLFIP